MHFTFEGFFCVCNKQQKINIKWIFNQHLIEKNVAKNQTVSNFKKYEILICFSHFSSLFYLWKEKTLLVIGTTYRKYDKCNQYVFNITSAFSFQFHKEAKKHVLFAIFHPLMFPFFLYSSLLSAFWNFFIWITRYVLYLYSFPRASLLSSYILVFICIQLFLFLLYDCYVL